MDLITLADITAAADRIRPFVVRTPLVPCPAVDTGAELWVKPESLQPVGAFKIRGAANALGCLDPHQRAAGVVTHSSGNHGQALAYAARAAGLRCVVVVPEEAPEVKLAAMRRFGAELVVVTPAERQPTAERLVAEQGLSLVPPFDHRDVIAGQGTIGVEILQNTEGSGASAGVDVDTVLVPVGGGGLAAGVATAVKALRPAIRVIGVEPELAGDAAESLQVGRLVSWPPEQTGRTIADGVRVGPSELTFAHLRQRLDGIVTVTEDEIRRAMGALARDARVVAEPSGAVAAAAVLAGKAPPGRAVAVVSGGNVAPASLAEVLTRVGAATGGN